MPLHAADSVVVEVFAWGGRRPLDLPNQHTSPTMRPHPQYPYTRRLNTWAAALLLLGAAAWPGPSLAADAPAAPAPAAADKAKAGIAPDKAKAAPVAASATAPAADTPVAAAAPAEPLVTKPSVKPPKPAEAHAKAPPAAAALPAATPKTAAKTDPMEVLREKLASKLGAAPHDKAPHVLKVTSKAEAGHGTEGARGNERMANILAALRAEKAAALAGGGHGSGHTGGHAGAAHAPHWAYVGEGGPETWGQLKPEFAKCSSGTRQSPIDIRGGVTVDLDPVQFDYRATGFNVEDNGHTVQVNLAGGNSIEVLGRRYELVQFHFHRPSEERINGRQFDMVAHLVHKDPQGRLAVVAVLLDRGSVHPLVQTVWNNLPLEKGDVVAARTTLDMNALLPKDRRYYTYMGSLTTPPCSEGVLWMVMQQPVTVSNEQIAVFSRLYPMNARPIQSASGRLIKQSN